MAITGVRVKGLMTEFWTSGPDDLQPRISRFIDLIRDGITEGGIRICTDQRTGNPCIYLIDTVVEVHELPDTNGNPYTGQYLTYEVLIYLDDADDPARLESVMDNLALGTEYPYSSWRPAALLTSAA
ncbi:hypothetical protein [Gordonia malaquae]|uniref:hypothetical protein n=1 Tax=Gordonia malaquae TaxID=410332 RepID=UPI00301808CC